MIEYAIAISGVSLISAIVIYLQIKNRWDTRPRDDAEDAKWMQRWGF